MRAYVRGERCLMELLQESLDDPAAEPCGRCSVCRDGLPEALDGAPSPETVATVTGLLRGQVHVLEPRKMWPGGAFGSRGRIPAEDAHEVGRTLVYADAPEWRETVAALFARDAPAPQDVLDACVRLLSQWRTTWRSRPEVVVDLSATGLPVMTGSVADHLGDGRTPRPGVAGRAGVAAGPAGALLRRGGRALEGPPRRRCRGRRRAGPGRAARGRRVVLAVAGDRGRRGAAAGGGGGRAPAAAAPPALTGRCAGQALFRPSPSRVDERPSEGMPS